MFRAVKRLMLSLREKAQPVKLDKTIEVDEVYVTAGLKGRNNSHLIRSAVKRSRRRDVETPKRRGRGTGDQDKPTIFVLVERGGLEGYIPSGDVEAETVLRIIKQQISGGLNIYIHRLF